MAKKNPCFLNKNRDFSFIEGRYAHLAELNRGCRHLSNIHNPKPLDLRLINFILPLLLFSGYLAKSAPQPELRDSATIIIRLDNFSNNNELIDSVYLILDRYDHTGAGVIKQVFHPVNNALVLTIPKGKYYINIFCLGLYKDKHFDIILNAKSRKRNQLLLKLEPSSFFIPGMVSMPEEKVDFGNLSVTSYAFRNK